MRRRAVGGLLLLAISGFIGCTKEMGDEEAPPIADYRTYDVVTVAVKEDPFGGGFVLLCKNSPIDRRTGFIQVLTADGELGARIDLDGLSLRIENLDFTADELLYTDVIPRPDGSLLLIGLGRESQQNDRLHALIQGIDRNGATTGISARRYLNRETLLNANDDANLYQDVDGLPRMRAIGASTVAGDVIVAARWETTDSAGIDLFRFPLSGATGLIIGAHLPLVETFDRLHGIACDPVTGRTLLIADAGEEGGRRELMAHEGLPGFSEWSGMSSSPLDLRDVEPFDLAWSNGEFIMTGHVPPADGVPIKPCISRIAAPLTPTVGVVVLAGPWSAERPVACYSAGFWEGGVHLALQVHEVSALPPYFEGDITSDLVVGDVLGDNTIDERETVIPGQGLRAIGYFYRGGREIIIGSQHPFLNASYEHTFYLVRD